jgi:hypothetical protein
LCLRICTLGVAGLIGVIFTRITSLPVVSPGVLPGRRAMVRNL